MSHLIELSDETWNKVSDWNVTPKLQSSLDRDYMTFNHDDRNGYLLISEQLMEIQGLNCLEFHIFIHLQRDQSNLETILMLDLPIFIGTPTTKQEAEMAATTLFAGAPPEYLDQPKVLEAVLSLESKGLIVIER